MKYVFNPSEIFVWAETPVKIVAGVYWRELPEAVVTRNPSLSPTKGRGNLSFEEDATN